jgi:hypothetical protein
MIPVLGASIIEVLNLMRGESSILLVLLFIVLDVWVIWYSFILNLQTRVIVSEEGLELQRGNTHLFTSWENVSHVGIKPVLIWQVSGLYLHKKIEPESTNFVEKPFLGRVTDFLGIGVVIPLPTHFGFLRSPIDFMKLAETEFGQDLARYAPHLLEERHEKHKVSD